ncbi:MAG: ABC transporter substrate-binding protein [Chthoniobacterales bacterium]|nr:ABC transporter substrate-binding protein [Chthoniobacterales bacterium]
MTLRALLVFAALVVVLAVPFVLRPRENLLAHADETLVILTPHNEAIRYEFGLAFSRWYNQKTNRSIQIDWRNIGGTSEIAKYLKSEYYNSFRREWEKSGRKWTPEVEAAFDNPNTPTNNNSEAALARKAFLSSNCSIGIDIFFGGGEYDFSRQAAAGRLIPSRILQTHPDWFHPDILPQKVSGETFYDPEGRWFGTCLSSFGIVYNKDSLRRLGIQDLPKNWEDLTHPHFFRQVALADPTKSGSAAKAFEMILQQQMQLAVNELNDTQAGIRVGWLRGLRIIALTAANARYFTDASSKVPVDVSLGDAAIGMCIDFYGRFQSEAVTQPDGSSRLVYFTPQGGSAIGVDPIGILRGAPNLKNAELFLEFVLSPEGQKLWNFRPGTPGGPSRYALRRPPIRKDLYIPQFSQFRSDPHVNPYLEAQHFTYHPDWTAPLFRSIAFIIRSTMLDVHDELRHAWQQILAAGSPPQAVQALADFSPVNYDYTLKTITPILRSTDRLAEVTLAKQLSQNFRNQYRQAATLAKKLSITSNTANP